MQSQFRLFLGCFIALVATAFGFAVRGAVLGDWGVQFALSEEEKGILVGVGLFPFAISIILFSLIIDKIGYGVSMAIAFIGHTSSALLTIYADSFQTLYIATFIFALSNGIVEAVINPVVATVYSKQKTHWLNILHAGWPGGLVLGGLLAIGITMLQEPLSGMLPGRPWQWQMGLVLLPTLVYGVLLMGQKFPQQERVSAGVSYREMLGEFGWGSSYIVFFLLIAGICQVLKVANIDPPAVWIQLAIAVAPTILFALYVKSFGRPMFFFLMLVMFLLATTELGTDGWIQEIIGSVLNNPTLGTLFFVWTSLIMFILRFFAGPIVHRISPLGLLAVASLIAAVGLFWLSVGEGVLMLALAATFYACGKTFFWPTTLGVVSERYPKGGALMLNAIAGVGMIAVGTIGGPMIGTVQDTALAQQTKEKGVFVTSEQKGLFFHYDGLDGNRMFVLNHEVKQPVNSEKGSLVEEKKAKLKDDARKALAALNAAAGAVYEQDLNMAKLKIDLQLLKENEAGEAAIKAKKKQIEELKDKLDDLRSKQKAVATDIALNAKGKTAVDDKALMKKLSIDPDAKDAAEQFDKKLAAAAKDVDVPKWIFAKDRIEELASKPDSEKYLALREAHTFVNKEQRIAKQGALAKIAILPAIMLLCYLALIFYFRSKGGYQAEVLAGHAADDEEFTGGVEGPVE